jgi:hypothetical protein
MREVLEPGEVGGSEGGMMPIFWTDGYQKQQYREGPAIGTRAWWWQEADRAANLCREHIAFGRPETAQFYAEHTFHAVRMAGHALTQEPRQS